MRMMVVLRGAPGCGKSTWVEKCGLKPYVLCAEKDIITLRNEYEKES